jgi:uncharacterized protein (TIGR02452 family)
MSREDRIACFEDTLKRCNDEMLAARTARAVADSRVYPAGFVSNRLYKVWEQETIVAENGSFAAARENLPGGRVAVLNFANPHYPGGGVTQGTLDQEECLCRSSNLYPCLNEDGVFEEFYGYHRTKTDYDFSDRLIYSPGVTVFKDDSPVPQLLAEEDWFRVDVITCAAPYLTKKRYVNQTVLRNLLKSRIRNILEAAIDNEAEVLILGAFGCGAFGNPPEVVAKAFREVLAERRYGSAFARVVFAIRSSVGGDPYTVCPNIAAFQQEFQGESAELQKLRYVGGTQNGPGTQDVTMPGGRVRYRGSESRAYHSWREKNPYFGKRFSVLGDSISTLEGFHPRGNPVFYDAECRERSGIWEMGDTWWGKVIEFFGGELLVNDSWSGCRVARPQGNADAFPCGCSEKRTGRLHVGDVTPDVILIYMGINDWGVGVIPEPAAGEGGDTCFSLAYGRMLTQLRRNYPQAEIWCCTQAATFMESNPNFRFPESCGGVHIREYNHQIVNAALASGCCVADLYSQEIPFDTLDGTHPTAKGMDTLAMLMVRQMADEDGGELLDCELRHAPHNGICRRCGRPMPEHSRESALRLKRLITGEILSGAGWQVTLGRSPDCGIVLANPYVARSQATFTCREGQWYLRDNGTKNGTTLNGTRLETDKEYRIHPGDMICFAQKEDVQVLL